jgi:integrase
MASIRKRRKKWYSRVQWRENGKGKEKEIPLKTELKSEAVIRNNEVEKVEDTIKEGKEWLFSWMQDGERITLVSRTLSEIIDEFYSIKLLDNLKPRTMEAYHQGLDCFIKVLGSTYPIENISSSDINIFKAWSRKKHSPSTTNLCLQKIKSFLKYCYQKKYIAEEIHIEMLKVAEKTPMYLSEDKLLKLFSSDSIDLHYRKAIYFYTVTGCRLEEPFNGEIQGNWLIITSEVSKTSRQREVELDDNTRSILYEMRGRVESGIGKSGHGSKSATRRWLIKRYSRQFKKCAISEGFGHHHCHNLRDTYAVRRWAETGDIHLVSKEIGHTSVKMTEKYANFQLRRLKDDFPSIADKIQMRLDKSSSNGSIFQLGSGTLLLK